MLAQLVSLLVVPMLGYVGYITREVKKSLGLATAELHAIATRLTRVETKLEDHERWDNERFALHHRYRQDGE